MPWHTKDSLRSTSSQEQVEEFSLTSYLDTLQLELAKSNPSPEASCSKDRTKDSSQSSPSGTMSRQWMVAPGGEQLTFFAEDSPAKTSQQQTLEVKALKEVAQDFGRSMRGWLRKCSLALSSQKTPLCCEVKGLEPSSKTWPRWGIMQDGVLSELGTSLTVLTGETECGYWPTATTDTSLRKKKYSQGGTPLSLAVQHSHWLTPTCFDGTKATKGLSEWSSSSGLQSQPLAYPSEQRSQGGQCPSGNDSQGRQVKNGQPPQRSSLWWAIDPANEPAQPELQQEDHPTEPLLGRVADGLAHRVDRLKAIGNGQVPQCAALAWKTLSIGLV